MALGDSAVEVRRMLPGELPDTDRLDEIRHWHAVYTELWEGCLDICEGLAPADRELVLSRAQRFKAGLDHWTLRRRDHVLSREPSAV
jgi:hypothetical protein